MTRSLLPPGATADATVLLQTRGLRALGDGTTSIVLTAHLGALGLSETRIGVVITATLLGSAALSIAVGLRAHAHSRRHLLQALSILMVATGIGFALATSFWPLVLIAVIGTLNPSGGDVSPFLPTEQSVLPATVSDRHRTALFARYSLLGTLVAAVGAALAGVPEWAAGSLGIAGPTALRWTFLGYAALGAVVLLRYRRLSPAIEPVRTASRAPLGPSKGTVHRLAVLFSLDSFGSGFAGTAIVVLWLQNRFGLSLAVSGAVLSSAGLLSAWSQLLAVRLAARIGLVRTMVYTHLPANVLLVLAALMPSAPLAVACLLGRAALSQMDVPARASYVMAVVTPEERPAAASFTNVPRSLAAALPPLAAGWMLGRSDLGWPLLLAGAIKIAYDLLLLRAFCDLRPPEEREVVRSGR